MTNPFTLTKEQYQELYQEVLLFAKIGGVVNDEEGIWKMCYEEFVNELLPAIEDDQFCRRAEDRIQVIDGVADSFVVMAQLHNYFMSKPSWEQPQPVYNPFTESHKFCLEFMISHQSDFIARDCLYHLGMVMMDCALQHNFNLYKAIKEVNRSNMTKFPSQMSLIERYNDPINFTQLAAEECELLSNGKYKNVWAKCNSYKTNELNVVIFRENFGKGKICKPLWHFEEPDFTRCLLENN